MSTAVRTMRALVRDADGVRLASVPDPTAAIASRDAAATRNDVIAATRNDVIAANYDVIVDVAIAGICRTDLAVADGTIAVPRGRILGHELSGFVDGTPVTVIPFLDDAWLGIDRDGAFAERVAVPARCVLPLPRGMSMVHGAYVEPVAAALGALPHIRPGDRVLVTGQGRIAELTARVIATMPVTVSMAAMPVASMPVAATMPVASMPVAATMPVASMPVAATMPVASTPAATMPVASMPVASSMPVSVSMPVAVSMPVVASMPAGGFDVIVEHDGAAPLHLLKRGGVLVLKSRNRRGLTIDAGEVVARELVIRGASHGSFHAAIDWLHARRIVVDDLLAAPRPLEDWAAAFADARAEAKKQLFAVRP